MPHLTPRVLGICASADDTRQERVGLRRMNSAYTCRRLRCCASLNSAASVLQARTAGSPRYHRRLGVVVAGARLMEGGCDAVPVQGGRQVANCGVSHHMAQACAKTACTTQGGRGWTPLHQPLPLRWPAAPRCACRQCHQPAPRRCRTPNFGTCARSVQRHPVCAQSAIASLRPCQRDPLWTVRSRGPVACGRQSTAAARARFATSARRRCDPNAPKLSTGRSSNEKQMPVPSEI